MESHTFRYFFIPYLMFLILAVMYISMTAHGDAVLWLNGIQNELLNVFFKIWTYGGDGIVYGIVAIVLLIKKRRFGYIFLLVGLVQGLASWSMKHLFFKGTPRPRKYFEGQNVLDLIEGVRIHDFNSFPSGHTMTAFAIATFLTFVLAKREWAVALLLAAVLVGISRMYLNQHFLIDVTVGSSIGVLVSYFAYKAFEKYLTAEDKVN